MENNTFNKMPTALLFDSVNNKRQATQQSVLENALLASKLGILMAVKTDKYINFRHDIVELTGRQVIALTSILDEYFNVNMQQEVRDLLIEPNMPDTVSNDSALLDGLNKQTQNENNQGLFKRIKRFFGRQRA